jgi:hypothetical protein
MVFQETLLVEIMHSQMILEVERVTHNLSPERVNEVLQHPYQGIVYFSRILLHSPSHHATFVFSNATISQ